MRGPSPKKTIPRVDGTIEEVPEYVRRSNPYLCTHHRLHHNKLSDAIGSLFTLHNETLNIWLHIIPIGLFLHLIYSVYNDPNKASQDHIMFACYLGSCCVLFACSSLYHLFYCVSQQVHDWTLALDFLGIIFVIGSSFLIALHYGFYCVPHTRQVYTTITLFINGCLIVTPFLRIPLYTRKLLYVATVSWAILPIGHLLILYSHHPLLKHVAVIVALYFGAFVIYNAKFPERFFPRSFDLVGASHQIWHAMLDVAFIYFYFAMESVHYEVSYGRAC